ncbi:MAG TPA: hypothetical protein VL503_01665 [Candidatus Omnitrophota bacterium]|jgi:hypothetical protein|nr:hypothetical protein [Candidatus Omnitrophota bacterium]
MPRASKSRSRKSHAAQVRARAMSAVERLAMRRYLAFVRAVVGQTTKSAAR